MSNKKYDIHLFVCNNERTDGRASCGFDHGNQLAAAFKEAIDKHGLKGKVRANKAGCLDVCAYGPALVVYPEGVWYGAVQPDDVAEIVEQHLLQGKPVERLMINFRQPASRWKESLRNDLAAENPTN